MYIFNQVKVFSTSGSDILGKKICDELGDRLPENLTNGSPITLSPHTVAHFHNQNIEVQVGESVRGALAIVIHSQVPPVSDNLLELFSLLDALKNAKAASTLLVFPYMPYSRSDRKDKPRISVMSKWMAQVINSVSGVNDIILLDPHSEHIKHYFDPAADEISAIYLFVDFLNKNIFDSQPKAESVAVFSDAGAAKRYMAFPHLLGINSAYIDKERQGKKLVFKRVVGEVKGKYCLLIDDEILTGGTAIGDAKELLAQGAKAVDSIAVHPLLADRGVAPEELIGRFKEAPIGRFIVTDSIPHIDQRIFTEKFTVLSVASLLAEAIACTIKHGSLNELHKLESVDLYR